MKHIWSEYKTDTADVRFATRSCSRCGLNQMKTGSGRMLTHVFSRGIRIWPTISPMPECVDWDLENQKTID